MNEEFSQIVIAALTDTEQLLLAAGRVFARHKASPGCEIPPLRGGQTIADGTNYSAIVAVDSISGLDQEVMRLLSEHPDWCGNEKLNRLFLVQTPEEGYAIDDESSPYYVVKRRLLEAGIPCQMVDTGTLQNPDWKDLNLALNITAKCGIAPWVLPENIPDADFSLDCPIPSPETDKGLWALPTSSEAT